MFGYFELARAIMYAVAAVLCLYITIEYANRGYKHVAGVMGTLGAFHGALFLSVVARSFGLSDIASRALITPAVLANLAAIVILAVRNYRVYGRKDFTAEE